MASEKRGTKGQAWFCTSGLPSDVVIEVDDMAFHLHKFPIMSKSMKLHELITEQDANSVRVQATAETENEAEGGIGEEEGQPYHISLPNFPGGSEIFETAVKFCYGVKIELSSSNVAPLRCAGEFLEMTEEYSEGNLISMTESYLSHSVFKSLRNSIRTLNLCEGLMPMAETLGIVQRCIDSIAARASSSDPTLFRWLVNDGDGNDNREPSNQSLWNGIQTGARRKATVRTTSADSWFEEFGLLSLPLFNRLVFAMKATNLSPEILENCLIYYAKRHIPVISRSKRKPSSSSVLSESEQREVLETITDNLPLEKSSISSLGTRFLFGLLRTANILKASDACRTALEKKIGSQLDQATLDDLLMPSYSYLNETLYDIDCIERILGYFLYGLEERSASRIEEGEDEDCGGRSAALMLVGKLIDGYLSEIASDANLKPVKFYKLATALPDHARLFDDGLYRAVDVYLKAHPCVSESEREKICGAMDCQNLTLEACTHAAQNERLPLRAVVQVLFFEQLQLRHAITGTLLAGDVGPADTVRPWNLQGGGEEEEEEENDEGVLVGGPRAVDSSSTWGATVRENQVLRLDMDRMRSRVQELERECSYMKKTIETMDKVGPSSASGGGNGSRNSLARKFGCKFKTQVCDSHEPAAVLEARKGRNQRRLQ